MEDHRGVGTGGAEGADPIDQIYQSLVDKINILDKLNAEYKVKQEHHFINAFMNVIEKIGNELLLAQEAYKNVDWEVRKDSYCFELAEQINFYRKESSNLMALLTKTQEQLKTIKLDKEHTQNELQYTRQLYEKKTLQCLGLKAEVKLLKKQLRSYECAPQKIQGMTAHDISSQQHKAKEGLSTLITSQRDTADLVKRRLRSTQISKAKDLNNIAIESENNLGAVKNSLTLTPVSVKRVSLDMHHHQCFSTTKAFRKRSSIPEHRRILPEQYIPDIKP